jgi:tetratricopeptide (TPR) repeat protein
MYGGYEIVHQAYIRQETRSLHNASTVQFQVSRRKIDIVRWRAGEVDTARFLRTAQLNRFEESVYGVRKELRETDHHKALSDIVHRVLNNLEVHFLESVADDHERAEALMDVAAAFERQGDHSSASERYREALALFRRLGDGHREAEVLAAMAKIQAATYDWAQALEMYEKSIGLLREAGDRVAEAEIALDLADRHGGRKEWNSAETLYRTSLEALDEAADGEAPDDSTRVQTLVAQARSGLGVAYFGQERWRESAVAFQQALEAARRLDEQGAAAQIASNLAAAYGRQGELDSAREHYNIALDIFRAIGDRPSEMEVQAIIGSLESDAGSDHRRH